ncbi:response regulator transcription factor [Natronogracilivirga saccharolytica]|uniref:Response regulator transcription factor n=1 Tax=Natronogracilivirga saccharolytica TaxID=2812953 RepID=A0A8J7UWP3_9BACT|nr:response regulator transcription factor [Natronogracilivirga saccharolytica]MBP3192459.1 response regulator transcription factor [Natronogracilivirga saccharolytica]
MKILVIEDDRIVRTLVKHVLEKEGHEVAIAERGETGEKTALEESFDIIVLDLGLPDKNGLEVCKVLRDNDIKTPILILSAYQNTDTKITGLNTGADDYLTKPFDNKELLARIDAITRRVKKGDAPTNVYECGELRIDLVNREFYVRDVKVLLTNNEFNLMAYFMKNPNRILEKDELTNNVWDINFDTNTNFLNVYISYLRKKIEEITPVNYIQTVRKKGFMLKCGSDS